MREQESHACTGSLEENLITPLSEQLEGAIPPTYLALGDRSQRLDQFQPLCISFSLSDFRQPRHRLLHHGLHNALELPMFLAQ